MKVYKVIRDTKEGELGRLFCLKEGDLVCECPDGFSYVTKGYPLYYLVIENTPDLFKLLFDDKSHDPDYYIKPIYTQYQMEVKTNDR